MLIFVYCKGLLYVIASANVFPNHVEGTSILQRNSVCHSKTPLYQFYATTFVFRNGGRYMDVQLQFRGRIVSRLDIVFFCTSSAVTRLFNKTL